MKGNPWINKVTDEERAFARAMIQATKQHEVETLLVALTIVLGMTITEMATDRADAIVGANAVFGDLKEYINDLYCRAIARRSER